MASSILETLNGLVGPSMLGSVATQLGEPEQSVATGLRASIATILTGLVGKASNPGAMQQVFDLATKPGIADASSVVTTGMTATPAASASGRTLLSTLFGGNESAASNAVANTSGLKPSSASSLMAMAAPLVLSVLGSKAREGGLNAAGLGNMLLGEKDSILRAAPAGLGSMFGLGDMARPRTEYTAPRTVTGTTGPVAEPARSGRGWAIPLVGTLAVLGLLWAFWNRGTHTANTVAVTTDTTQTTTRTTTAAAGGVAGSALDSTGQAAGNAAAAAAGAAGAAAANLGAFVKTTLPDGTTLNVPSNGVESKLLGFLNDANRPVTDTLWFNFDRLNFETGSSKLRPESQEQLNNVAAILKAYPSVALKIGGYTDNTGSAAANMKLSQDRANTVTSDLVGQGIANPRLVAEGYGDAHPVADNSTPEGRAQNRRIAMRVTKK